MAEVNCQAQQCSPFGSNNETEFTAASVTAPSIYLNTDHPAPCSGTVERWKFCFYRPDTHEDGDRYRVRLAAYRSIESGNSTLYEIVGSSLRTITVNFPTQSSSFSCQNITLNTAQRFPIEADDIVAACVFNPTRNNIEQMDIVSEANGYKLMQSVGLRCSYNSIPSTIYSSQLMEVESRLLHLSAIITGSIIDHRAYTIIIILPVLLKFMMFPITLF